MAPTTTFGLTHWIAAEIRKRDWRWDAFVLLGYFFTAKLAQYILFSLHTSPALIWAPTGIALAAVLLKGDRMWLPICIAYSAAILTLPAYLPVIPTIIAIAGFTLQPVLGAWGLRQFNYADSIYQTSSVIRFIIASFIIAGIGPLFNTLGQVAFQALSASAWLTFTRAWAGGLLGILICTPLIIAWCRTPTRSVSIRQLIEPISAFGFLFLSIYLLFWTTLPASLVFLLIFFLCVVLIWIALRFDERAITTALLVLAIAGIAGSIIGHPTPTPLNQQLFADELFMIILAPIFLIFFTLMEERRQTERVLAEKVFELEQITERLSDESRAKNEFIAILAHELRNPLASIVSTIELMKLEVGTPDALRMLERNQQQTNAMRRLLDDLLDVARITERKFAIFKETVDVRSLIEHSVTATATALKERSHSLKVELPASALFVSIDPVRIEQVVTNLLTNAAKYTPAGGTVTLHCWSEGESLYISVEDSGQGIPPEQLGNIFLPFQQLNPGGRSSNGVGIGLFLTRHVVEMHEGTITAQSEGAGMGSAFIVRLPLSAQTHGPVVPAIEKPERTAVATLSRPLRIMVVDDNESAAVGLSKLLQYKGHTTTTAHDGAEAIALLPEFEPDVILLDIGLPDMDGYEVAAHIRPATGPKLIMIALTGYGQAEDRAKALAAGFDFHLTKPVGIAEVEDTISRIISERSGK